MKEGEMGGACSTHGRAEKSIKNIRWKPERKRQLERARRKLEDNFRMDLKEIGSEVVDWVQPAQDRDQWWAPVNIVMNLRDP
jgi:hypothetical protein